MGQILQKNPISKISITKKKKNLNKDYVDHCLNQLILTSLCLYLPALPAFHATSHSQQQRNNGQLLVGANGELFEALLSTIFLRATDCYTAL
jgi:hypothetical protein